MIGRAALLGCVLLTVPLWDDHRAEAQSLAEIARREAERRETIASPRKVYTNGDLIPDFTAPPEPPPPPTEELATSQEEDDIATGRSGEASQAPPEGKARNRNEKGEDYWRGRASLIRGRLEKQRAQLDALQLRISELARLGDSSNEQERDLTRDALNQARTDLAYLEAEWTNFENTARAKKVPDAWIR